MREALNKHEPLGIIRKRKNAALIKSGYLSLLIRVIVLGLLGTLLFTQVFLISQAKGMDMFPSIKDGDLLVVFRLHQNYEKDDVITYQVNGTRHIGRLIAFENDVVTLDETGVLLVNGTVQGGEILYPSYAKENLEYPYRVPENHVFILGDYRTQTRDSRDYGPISKQSIEGKIITILRRRGL